MIVWVICFLILIFQKLNNNSPLPSGWGITTGGKMKKRKIQIVESANRKETFDKIDELRGSTELSAYTWILIEEALRARECN